MSLPFAIFQVYYSNIYFWFLFWDSHLLSVSQILSVLFFLSPHCVSHFLSVIFRTFYLMMLANIFFWNACYYYFSVVFAISFIFFLINWQHYFTAHSVHNLFFFCDYMPTYIFYIYHIDIFCWGVSEYYRIILKHNDNFLINFFFVSLICFLTIHLFFCMFLGLNYLKQCKNKYYSKRVVDIEIFQVQHNYRYKS